MLQKRITEILSPEVVSVGPETGVAKAVELMHRRRISCIPVIEAGQAVGMFTERDIVLGAAKHGQDFIRKPMNAVMSAPVVTVRDHVLVYEAYRLLSQYKIRHLVAIGEGGEVAGVVTLTDLHEGIGFDEFFEFKKVSQIMSEAVARIKAEASLREAVELLHMTRACCLAVVEAGLPAGIVTERDVASAIATGLSLRDTRVSQVMSAPVVSVGQDESISDAARVMRSGKVRRLAVTGEGGGLAGLITSSDIVRALNRGYVEMLKNVIRKKDNDLSLLMDKLTQKSLYLDNILRFSMGMGIVATDENMRVAFVNEHMAKLMGTTVDAVMGESVIDLHVRRGIDRERIEAALDKARQNGRHSFSLNYQNGVGVRYLEAELSGIPGNGAGQGGYLLMLRDVTERKKAEDTIMHMAMHDALTGLPNRYMFLEHFESELSRSRRLSRQFALLVIDLNDFKRINDTYGHQTGDAILREFAAHLKDTMREYDMAARFGGDEFIVLVADHRKSRDVASVAGRILARLQTPFYTGGMSHMIRVSIGASIYPQDGESFQELNCMADNAMYAAKECGRENQGSNFVLSADSPSYCRLPDHSPAHGQDLG